MKIKFCFQIENFIGKLLCRGVSTALKPKQRELNPKSQEVGSPKFTQHSTSYVHSSENELESNEKNAQNDDKEQCARKKRKTELSYFHRMQNQNVRTLRRRKEMFFYLIINFEH